MAPGAQNAFVRFNTKTSRNTTKSIPRKTATITSLVPLLGKRVQIPRGAATVNAECVKSGYQRGNTGHADNEPLSVWVLKLPVTLLTGNNGTPWIELSVLLG